MSDYIQMLLSVPPKYCIEMVVGYLKGKSAIHIHCSLLRTQGTLFGQSFWARDYFVSTFGIYEDQIREYIKEQEKSQKDQIEFDFD